MTLKEIFRTIEGIIILAAFVSVIVTGAKIFAYLGLAGYTLVNLKNGVSKAVKLIKLIVKSVKGLFKKSEE